ncbi:MAG: S8 family serine peptidase [Anaerolineae bacterium]
MNRYRLLNAGLALGLTGALLLALLAVARATSAAQPAKIAPQVWAATVNGGQAEFLVILTEQANLSAAAALPTRQARLRYVYDTLRETALRSQNPLRTELDSTGVEYRPFYIVNMLAVRGDRALVTRLAARPEVARIAANPRVRQSLPEPRPDGVRSLAPQGIAWNVARVNADGVWALGHTGTNVVVAGQDTGYDWDHPALIGQYRGYNGVTATHDYNWHDAIHSGGGVCGADSPAPCDDHGHGTHTMGTIVGDDGAGNQVGVAPGARWIGCRNMDQGVGTPATYIECFEFFLAPYPIGGDPFTEGNPSLAPHVINNSWTCPPSEGCDWDTLQAVVENVRAAGIVVVASAGNAGPACSTVEDPPAIYNGAFSVGATDGSDNIAGFSSRGPVAVDGSGRLKPDVSAPGVGVRSSLRGGGYISMSGTSMAGPHVAGTVALLWSAAPRLIGDVDTTEWIIARAARPHTTTQGCGGDGPEDVPNHVYGWGIVDALAAVESALSGVEIGKQAAFPMGLPARLLVYTLSVTNTSYPTLTQVVVTDAIPASTTFAWADGNYTQAGGGSSELSRTVVIWTAESLAGQEVLTATLAVTVEYLPPGTRVVNAAYGVRASELLTPVMGTPVETIIPWRCLLFPIFKDWSSGDNGGG